jgi:hypothetical protein
MIGAAEAAEAAKGLGGGALVGFAGFGGGLGSPNGLDMSIKSRDHNLKQVQ